MPNDSFNTELRELMRRHPLFRRTHPFWLRCFRGRQNEAELRQWALDVYPFVRDFPLLYLNVAAKCDSPALLTPVCETIYEETGSGKDSEAHWRLFLRFVNAIGVTAAETGDTAMSPAGRALLEYAWSVVRRGTFLEGLALVGLGLERPLPRLFPMIARALQRQRGLSERDVEYFSLHGVADVKHSQAAMIIVSRLATNPEARARVREILTGLWNLQQSHLDSLGKVPPGQNEAA